MFPLVDFSISTMYSKILNIAYLLCNYTPIRIQLHFLILIKLMIKKNQAKNPKLTLFSTKHDEAITRQIYSRTRPGSSRRSLSLSPSLIDKTTKLIALWSTREWAAKGGFRNRFACRKCPLHLWEVFHAKSGPKSPLLPPCWGTYFTCRSDFFFVCVCAVLGTKIYMCSLAGSFHEFGFSCSSHFIHQQVYCHFGSWSRRCSKQQQQQQKVDVWKIWLSGWMVWQNQECGKALRKLSTQF